VDTDVGAEVIAGADPRARAFRIRSATLTDCAVLAALLSQSFPLVPSGWEWLLPLVRLGIYEDLRLRLREPVPFFPGTEPRLRYACWVVVVGPAAGESGEPAEPAETIVGTAEMSWKPGGLWRSQWAEGQAFLVPPYLANLAVAPTMRRQGVAEALLATCEREAQAWGRSHIDLHVMADNLPARQLYLKVGYQIQHRESDWRTWLLQRPQRLLLRKSLS
jgi:ribosomal protein S18 acetylase RimI-like enzyme